MDVDRVSGERIADELVPLGPVLHDCYVPWAEMRTASRKMGVHVEPPRAYLTFFPNRRWGDDIARVHNTTSRSGQLRKASAGLARSMMSVSSIQ